ncbi:hypothetical protein K488DRAFT_89930 [Vararia minispora EC-137]|uniref:Uncharacterized protein n=1 Tax=Vararia minispora EC-137 TaxID=1314806 RepID=A0ACB8Q8X5_9AGAM|nr:hypothetical protein K488DRAFT_89930 [Vararia minispora EC-137]
MSTLLTSSNSTPIELGDALDASAHFVIRRLVPIFMVESIAFGEESCFEPFCRVQSVAGFASMTILLYSYILMRHLRSLRKTARQIIVSVLAYGSFVAHWTLVFRYIIAVLAGIPFARLGPYHNTNYNPEFRTYFSLFVEEAVLLGAHTALVLIVVVLFLLLYVIALAPWAKLICISRRNGASCANASRIFSLVSALIMYAMALVPWIVTFSSLMAFYHNYHPYSELGSWDGLSTGPTYIIISVGFPVIMLLGDAIVLWRACVIWLNSKRFRAICVFLFLLTFVPVVASIALAVEASLVNEGNRRKYSFRGMRVTLADFTLIPPLIAMSTSLLSNVFATGAIGYRAWKHRQTIRANLAETGSRRLMTEKVMALIIESGIAYVCIWIFDLWIAFDELFGSNVPSYSPFYSNYITHTMAAYPTIIIILVMVEKTSFEQQAVFSTPSHVAPPPIQLTLGTIISLQRDSESSPTISVPPRRALPPIQVSFGPVIGSRSSLKFIVGFVKELPSRAPMQYR